MQTEIKTICLVSMFAGIICCVIPPGRMKSAFSSFCAVAVVFYMISPLADIKADGVRLSVFDSEKNEELLLSEVRTAEVMLYEKMLAKALEEKLWQTGLNTSLEISCEKQGEEMKVLKITVANAGNEDDRQSIKRILTESLGDVEISFEEDENG